ncbi:MAG: thiolase family protein [Bradymonadia bacterium]
MPFEDNDVLLLEAARTPVGRFLGGLKKVSATDLGVVAAKGALTRARVPADAVDGVVVGNVLQSSKDAAYIARHIGLKAGVPEGVPAVTVNMACGSALEALAAGARRIRLGECSAVLAGGAENMSMMPYAMRGVREGWRMIKSDVDDMLFSALHDPMAGCAIGETVETVAEECGVTREQADAWAVESQRRAAAAQQAGHFAEEIVPVAVKHRRKQIEINADETLRPETTLEGLAALPPLYGGVSTAGNSTGLNDAGAMWVMASGAFAKAHGLKPAGRLLSWGAVGVAPIRMAMGPVGAMKMALDRAGRSLDDVSVIELNDSFTAQAIAVCDALGLDGERVNPNGGAVALGHPMGATGARLVQSALYGLRRGNGGLGLCTVCVGGGQGIAVLVEALDG